MHDNLKYIIGFLWKVVTYMLAHAYTHTHPHKLSLSLKLSLTSHLSHSRPEEAAMQNNKAEAQFLHTYKACTHVQNLNANAALTTPISTMADTFPHFDKPSHKSAARAGGGDGGKV